MYAASLGMEQQREWLSSWWSCPTAEPENALSLHAVLLSITTFAGILLACYSCCKRDISRRTQARLHRTDTMLSALLSGISEALLSLTDTSAELLDDDYATRRLLQLRLVPAGQRVTFTDFAPRIFRALRRGFGVSEAEFRHSLCHDSDQLVKKCSDGKSGATFVRSSDGRYIMKSLTESEKNFLLSFLPYYTEYVLGNTETLLPWFLGMYRAKAVGGGRKPECLRVVVMANVFMGSAEPAKRGDLWKSLWWPVPLTVHEQYDLKGSMKGRTVGRSASSAAVGGSVDSDTGLTGDESSGASGAFDAAATKAATITLKDLDWQSLGRRLCCDGDMRRALEEQLCADSSFLASQGIMDYSLLVGISFEPLTDAIERPFFDPAVFSFTLRTGIFWAKPSPRRLLSVLSSCRGLTRKLSGLESRFRAFRGGIPASRPSLFRGPHMGKSRPHPLPVCYYVGIIDVLQRFGIRKQIESAVKGAKDGRSQISAVEPNFYARRFASFMKERVLRPPKERAVETEDGAQKEA